MPLLSSLPDTGYRTEKHVKSTWAHLLKAFPCSSRSSLTVHNSACKDKKYTEYTADTAETKVPHRPALPEIQTAEQTW